MLDINNENISLTRGDTAIIELDITINNQPYIFSDADKIIFSVKQSYDDADYILQRQLTSKYITLNHEDTKSLEAGTYVYDVQISFADGQVVTYGPGKFKLTADVTRI